MAVWKCKGCSQPVGLPTQVQGEHPKEDCTVRCPCGVTYELTLEKGIVVGAACADPNWHERRRGEELERRANEAKARAARAAKCAAEHLCPACMQKLPATTPAVGG